MANIPPKIVIDKITLSMFSVSVMIGWFGYTLGPAVDVIRVEFDISRSAVSLLGTMIAAGGIIAAFLTVKASERLGRRVVMIGGTALSIIGVLLLIIGGNFAWALIGVLIAATARGLTVNAMTASITIHHGTQSSRILTYIHAVIAGTGILAPAALAVFIYAGVGWRPAFILWMTIAVLVVLSLSRLPRAPVLDWPQPRKATKRKATAKKRPLQRSFWLLAVVMVALVAAEWATVYWVGDLIRSHLRVPISVAALGASAFLLGQFLGRLVFGRLARRWKPMTLMMLMFPLALLGWATLWTGPTIVVALCGAIVMGVGTSATYPFLITLMTASSNGQPDRAIAIAGLLTAISSGTSPFLLASISDAFGPSQGFLFVLAALALSFVFAIVAYFRLHRELHAGARRFR